jgi:hypothetical protein
MTLQQALALLSVRAIGTSGNQLHIFVRRDPSLCLISFEACSFEACAATRNKQAN